MHAPERRKTPQVVDDGIPVLGLDLNCEAGQLEQWWFPPSGPHPDTPATTADESMAWAAPVASRMRSQELTSATSPQVLQMPNIFMLCKSLALCGIEFAVHRDRLLVSQ